MFLIPVLPDNPFGSINYEATTFSKATLIVRQCESYLDCRAAADGKVEHLPAMGGSYAIPQGATAAEEKEVRDRYLARNKEVERMLEEKGFVMTDQAHGSAILNRYLQTQPETESQR